MNLHFFQTRLLSPTKTHLAAVLCLVIVGHDKKQPWNPKWTGVTLKDGWWLPPAGIFYEMPSDQVGQGCQIVLGGEGHYRRWRLWPAFLGCLVALDVKLPSLQHLVGRQTRDHQHQLFHRARIEPLWVSQNKQKVNTWQSKLWNLKFYPVVSQSLNPFLSEIKPGHLWVAKLHLRDISSGCCQWWPEGSCHSG